MHVRACVCALCQVDVYIWISKAHINMLLQAIRLQTANIQMSTYWTSLTSHQNWLINRKFINQFQWIISYIFCLYDKNSSWYVQTISFHLVCLSWHIEVIPTPSYSSGALMFVVKSWSTRCPKYLYKFVGRHLCSWSRWCRHIVCWCFPSVDKDEDSRHCSGSRHCSHLSHKFIEIMYHVTSLWT